MGKVKELKKHQLFTMANPNRMRSLLRAFANNHAHYHRVDGEGYKFITEAIIELDKTNGRLAAILCKLMIPSQQ